MAAKNPFSYVWQGICTLYLKIMGWKMYGQWPETPKAVLIAAPHTSNWDGINMLAAAGFFRAKIKWMGKKSLTTGPFGGIVKWLGCVPVDRGNASDLPAQMADAFANSKEMLLAIPPEGTRAATPKWKTGFYRIAVAAKVPIMMTVLDYRSKSIRVSGLLWPSGDYEADLDIIRTHYADADGARAGKFDVTKI